MLSKKSLVHFAIQIISKQEHPRGPIVSIKRLPDVIRPVAYVDCGDGTWETNTLSLNLYGFLDSATMGGIKEPVVKALGIQEKQIQTFTRF